MTKQFDEAVELAKYNLKAMCESDSDCKDCGQVRPYMIALLEAKERIENLQALVKDICSEWNEDCNQTCDSYAHDEDCKSINIGKAKKAMRLRIEELEKENKRVWDIHNEFLNGKFVELQSERHNLREELMALEACLAEKDKALERNTHPHIESICKERSEKALALNPNQYQERVKARERVIEAASGLCDCAAEFEDPKYCAENFNKLDDALAELGQLEGDGK